MQFKVAAGERRPEYEVKEPTRSRIRPRKMRSRSQIGRTAAAVCLILGLLAAASGYSTQRLPGSMWSSAVATWYGDPEGDGSTGGACGYGTLVDVKPFRARVGAVGPVLFKNGEGCGACYKVKCLDSSICSRRAVTIIITDECPGCLTTVPHFDMSGAAFGRLAVAGDGGSIRNRGQISVMFRRTLCKYGGKNIAFLINEGSTNYWLSLLVLFENSDGDIGSMQLKEAGSNRWLEMSHVWGATWCMYGGPLQGPFSVRLTTLSRGLTLTAADVIPANWVPKANYTSRLNFFN